MGKLGLIGGTSLLGSDLSKYNLKPKKVTTEAGCAIVYTDPTGELPIVFVQRHHANGLAGSDVYQMPHKIDHNANLAALQAERVDKIIAVCCVGSLTESIPIGTLLLPDDYFSLFGPLTSFYNSEKAHVVPGIDLELRNEISEILTRGDITQLDTREAVYVQTTGPRFETRAEVRFCMQVGDVIGMTAATEATVAKELQIPYAVLAMVDNMCNGLTGSELTWDQFKANVAANRLVVEKALSLILAVFVDK